MKFSITLKMSKSYFDSYGKHIDKYYIKDDNIYIDIVKNEKEVNAMKKTIDYLIDNNIGLFNYYQFMDLVKNKQLRGDWDINTYQVCDINCEYDIDEYKNLLQRLSEITGDLLFVCNRYSNGGFGQPNGWSIIIESS